MSTIKPIRIETFADLVEYNYFIALFCLNCDRWHDLDIPELIDAGYGSHSYVGKTFKCKKCGNAAEESSDIYSKAQKEPPPPLYPRGIGEKRK